LKTSFEDLMKADRLQTVVSRSTTGDTTDLGWLSQFFFFAVDVSGATKWAELSHRGLASAQISPLIAELREVILRSPKAQGKPTV
jgi:hypothetical protein